MESQGPAGNRPAGGPERRLYIRQPLYLDALLTGRWSRSFGGKIRDYCPSGVFFAWDEPLGGYVRAEDNPIARDDPVVLAFTVETEDSKNKYEVAAKVARVLDAGVGLAFEKADPSALQVLQHLANRNLRQSSPLPRLTSLAPGADERQIISRCKETAAIRFSAMIETFFSEADEALFVCARDAASNVEQTQYFDASSELKKGKKAIAPEILGSLLDRIDEMGKPKSDDRDHLKDLAPTELSLVETNVLEDLLMVADIVTKAEPMFEDELYELEERFSHLIGARIDKSTNPVGVDAVCHTFAEGLDAITLAQKQRRVVFNTLNDAVVPALGQLYGELNALLKASDVLPELRRTTYTPSRKSTRKTEVPDDEDRSRPTAGTPVQEHDGGGSGRTSRDAPRPAEGNFPNAAEPETVIRAPSTPAEGQVGAADGQPIPAAQGVYRTARTLLGLQRGITASAGETESRTPADATRPLPLGAPQSSTFDLPATSPTPAPPSTSGGAFVAADDVLNALSALQREGDQPWRDQLEAPEMRARLQEVLKSQNPAGPARQIPDEIGNAIDMMSNLFESIAADGGLPDRLKALYRRLEIPLQKMAVLDPQVFDSTTHPARQLLNRLAELQTSTDSDATWDSELQQKVEAVVDKVSGNFERDPAVFSGALGELDHLAADNARLYQENVQRLVQDLERQQAFLKSRRKAEGKQDGESARRQQEMPKEWEVWLNRAKRLKPGDALALKHAGGSPQRVLVAWIGEDFNPYVFVNTKGEKAATMTLQELAMHLRRGTAMILDRSELPVVDRALYTTLFRMHDQIGQRALEDPGTGLLNRRHFREQLARAVEEARQGAAVHVLAHVEVDGIKPIIEKFGSSAGEALLRKIGRLLNKPLRDSAVLGRIGAQDFGVILEHYGGDEARAVAEEQLDLISKLRVKWKDQTYTLKPSTGLVVVAESSKGADELLAVAAGACVQARSAREGSLQFADTEELVSVDGEQRFDWRQWVAEVAESGKLDLFCQHIMPLAEKGGMKPQCQITAGARQEDGGDYQWMPPGLLEGDAFADSAGRFDRILMERALAWMASRRSRLKGLAGCVIPLCGHSLADEKLTETVLDLLTETAVPPGKICFQLHEKAAVGRLGEAERFVRTLKEFGCRFALDGMGSGTTASGYLNTLPVDFLKIDGIFVGDVGDNENDAAVIRSINEIAHLMGKRTIAPEINDEAALERLRTIGVDYGQGLCIEHAVALEDMK